MVEDDEDFREKPSCRKRSIFGEHSFQKCTPNELALAELTKRFDATSNPRHKLALAFALAKYGRVEVDYLVSRFDDLAATDTGNFITALKFDHDKAIAALKSNATKCIDKSTWRQKAKLSIAALLLGNSDLADDVCTIANPSGSRATDPFYRHFSALGKRSR